MHPSVMQQFNNLKGANALSGGTSMMGFGYQSPNPMAANPLMGMGMMGTMGMSGMNPMYAQNAYAAPQQNNAPTSPIATKGTTAQELIKERSDRLIENNNKQSELEVSYELKRAEIRNLTQSGGFNLLNPVFAQEIKTLSEESNAFKNELIKLKQEESRMKAFDKNYENFVKDNPIKTNDNTTANKADIEKQLDEIKQQRQTLLDDNRSSFNDADTLRSYKKEDTKLENQQIRIEQRLALYNARLEAGATPPPSQTPTVGQGDPMAQMMQMFAAMFGAGQQVPSAKPAPAPAPVQAPTQVQANPIMLLMQMMMAMFSKNN